jgi:nitroimidazol reductase NimA-like FMN-containing flavoprotein (pyridoxamine 5'-phosphate oxidase superfamily)
MTSKELWFASHIKEITREECMELLASRPVGRIAYCDESGPVVLPVNFVLEGDQVMFRTSPHSELARHLRNGPASFEVDEFDEYTQSGWSVLIRGRAEFIEYDDLPDEDHRPTPWAEGHRTFHVRVIPSQITGRRLLEA